MSRRTRMVIVLLIVLAGGAAGLLYWKSHGPPSDRLVLYGNVDIRQVDLSFDNEGRISQMLVEEGDRVETGQLLATLDPSRFEDAVNAAEGQLAQQRQVVAKLERGSRPQEIEQAKADVAAAAATAHDAELVARRKETLVASDSASRETYDHALATALAAQERLRAAQQALSLAVEGPRKEDVAAAKAQLQADEANLSLAQHRLRDTRLYAPQAGTVLTRILEPGAAVLPNTPAYTLALDDPVWVRTYVSETDLGRIFPDMKAEITTDSFPGRVYHGWVGFISPTAEFTPKNVETPDLRTALVYRLRVYVKNPDHTLRQGMPVTITLPLDRQPPPSTPGDGAPAPH
jgi:HlyD family secretion protein